MDKWLEQMKEISSIGDTEYCHIKADDLLIEIIRSFGLNNVADEYEKIEKWYA